MRYFSFNEPNDSGEDLATITVSEEDIRKEYYPFWYEQMCKKYGQEKVDQDYSFPDCLDDWITVHWAWEVPS